LKKRAGKPEPDAAIYDYLLFTLLAIEHTLSPDGHFEMVRHDLHRRPEAARGNLHGLAHPARTAGVMFGVLTLRRIMERGGKASGFLKVLNALAKSQSVRARGRIHDPACHIDAPAVPEDGDARLACLCRGPARADTNAPAIAPRDASLAAPLGGSNSSGARSRPATLNCSAAPRRCFTGTSSPPAKGEAPAVEAVARICPSPSKYQGIWNWDSSFHALGHLPLGRVNWPVSSYASSSTANCLLARFINNIPRQRRWSGIVTASRR